MVGSLADSLAASTASRTGVSARQGCCRSPWRSACIWAGGRWWGRTASSGGG